MAKIDDLSVGKSDGEETIVKSVWESNEKGGKRDLKSFSRKKENGLGRSTATTTREVKISLVVSLRFFCALLPCALKA